MATGTRKFAAILITACLLMISLSATVSAESGIIRVGGVELSDGQYLANDSQTPQTTRPEGGYAYWDAATATLTLSDYVYAGDEVGIFTNINRISLTLVGESVLTCADYGIRGDTNNITIQGDGSLTVSAVCGIYATDSIHLHEDVTVTAVAATAEEWSAAIYAEGNIQIDNNVTITATGDRAKTSYGIRGGGNIIMNDSATVTTTGGEAAERSFGVYSYHDIYINGGKTTATGGNASAESYGIFVEQGWLVLRDATVCATGGDAPICVGVTASDAVRIEPREEKISVQVDQTQLAGSPFTVETDITDRLVSDSGEKYKFFFSYPGVHEHNFVCDYDDTGHWQVCDDTDCPFPDKGKTQVEAHVFDDKTDTDCVCGYTRKVENPSTGDADLGLWLALAALSLLGLAGTVVKNRNKA